MLMIKAQLSAHAPMVENFQINSVQLKDEPVGFLNLAELRRAIVHKDVRGVYAVRMCVRATGFELRFVLTQLSGVYSFTTFRDAYQKKHAARLFALPALLSLVEKEFKDIAGISIYF